jgi:hypothetical protein
MSQNFHSSIELVSEFLEITKTSLNLTNVNQFHPLLSMYVICDDMLSKGMMWCDDSLPSRQGQFDI